MINYLLMKFNKYSEKGFCLQDIYIERNYSVLQQMNVDFQKSWVGYFITNLKTIPKQDRSHFKINQPTVHHTFQVNKHQNLF